MALGSFAHDEHTANSSRERDFVVMDDDSSIGTNGEECANSALGEEQGEQAQNQSDDRWERLWQKQFECLKLFKKNHGHTRVPQTWNENKSLGKWVSRQRSKKINGELRGDREAKLKSIGFFGTSSDSSKIRNDGGSVESDGDESESSASCQEQSQHGTANSYDLSTIRVGRRVAMEFDREIHFGEVEICFVKGRETMKWAWHVGFDDGETFELDREEMIEALSTYDACKEKEKSDPMHPVKVAGIVAAFETQKQLVLSKLPKGYEDHFLEVGFAKWSGRYNPVLFLGPYDISAGPVRERLIKDIKRAGENASKIPRLVYWYGAEDLEEAFSLVPQKDCLTIHEAKERDIANLPKSLQKKVARGEKLTPKEESMVLARNQMEEDAIKPKENRIRFVKIQEDHHWILSGERLISEVQAERDYDLLTWGDI